MHKTCKMHGNLALKMIGIVWYKLYTYAVDRIKLQVWSYSGSERLAWRCEACPCSVYVRSTWNCCKFSTSISRVPNTQSAGLGPDLIQTALVSGSSASQCLMLRDVIISCGGISGPATSASCAHGSFCKLLRQNILIDGNICTDALCCIHAKVKMNEAISKLSVYFSGAPTYTADQRIYIHVVTRYDRQL